MENTSFNTPQQAQPIVLGPESAASVRTFLSHVFTYMAMALVLSGAMAWLFAHTPSLLNYLYTVNAEGYITGRTVLGWVVMFAPLGLVFLMSGMVNRLSGTALLLTFIAYAVLTGISLCFIFLFYSKTAIIRVFFMSAGIFGIMAVAGYTTKTDLTKLGSLLTIGLFGIIIGSLINAFLLESSTMDYIISILGVIIFTGLTAYDMQKLKQMGGVVASGTEAAQKMALMGALSLYLDFINLFLMLLRLFGGRRD